MSMDVNLKRLVGRLDDTCTEALREAAHMCLSRGNYDVEVEHLLLVLLKEDETDLVPILRQWDVPRAEMAGDVERALREYRTGNTATPTFSPRLIRWLSSAWLLGSVNFDAASIRSGYLFYALLKDDEFAYRAREISELFKEIDVRTFEDLMERLLQSSSEASAGRGLTTASEQPGGAGAEAPKRQERATTEALEQFSIDLTEEARGGKIDRIIGRDPEIRQMIDVLLRRRKNNPIVVGEAGVGKTAVVEGLALRIAEGDVPEPLANVTLRTLDLALLQAGAGVRGEFENRLKQVIQEVKASPTPIVLFIDEAHNLIGAGGQSGQGDAANLLKPALARGELRTIAATTYAEFKKHVEKDPALERRFQPIHVAEPTVETAILMMRAIAEKLEAHHGVTILDEAVRDAVGLGDRYISGRNLPDKSVDILDTACARVALARASLPEPIEDTKRWLWHFEQEEKILQREMAVGDADHQAAIEDLATRRSRTQARLDELQGRYEEACALLDRIAPMRKLLESRARGTPTPEDIDDGLEEKSDAELREQLGEATRQLAELQGEDALVAICVDAETVAHVISSWTGIPVGKMVRDEIEAVQRLERDLEARVIGQSTALKEIAKRVQTSRAGLEDPNKPIGVFLMAGPSGVGKTETALALAEILYGGERNLITVNMSEYQEAHSVSGLKGSPKGYVGYGEGGALTEPVRQRPYSVVLLDEVEKAHKDVMEIFYQVFDKGSLEDTTGRVIDFKNTIIFLTSNLGGDQIIQAMLKREGSIPSGGELYEIVMPQLRRHFPAAFLGRVTVLPFAPLPDDVLANITRLKLQKIIERVRSEHRIALTFADEVVDSIVDRCVEVESGARNIDHIVANTILPGLGRNVLGWLVEDQLPERVEVSVGEGGSFCYLRDGEPAPATSLAKPTAEGSSRAEEEN